MIDFIVTLWKAATRTSYFRLTTKCAALYLTNHCNDLGLLGWNYMSAEKDPTNEYMCIVYSRRRASALKGLVEGWEIWPND